MSFILKVFIEPCHQILSVDWLYGPFSLFLLKVSCETVICVTSCPFPAPALALAAPSQCSVDFSCREYWQGPFRRVLVPAMSKVSALLPPATIPSSGSSPGNAAGNQCRIPPIFIGQLLGKRRKKGKDKTEESLVISAIEAGHLWPLLLLSTCKN